MGREIRRVPPNWKHPQVKNQHTGRMDDQSMYDARFEDRLAEWLLDFDRIRAGQLTDNEREWYPRGLGDWIKDETPPDPDYYRPWSDEEATWWQAWQTVSEGTPVSPPFATQEELIDYLATHGDFWDQKRGDAPWGREAAERFVKAGWAVSFIAAPGMGVVAGKLIA